MRVILTRHGQTIDNINGILQGHKPGKLSSNGIKQAKKLALRLKKEKFDAIFSSDLARAYDTAKIIANYHKKTPFFSVRELREIDLKNWTGKKWPSTNKERKQIKKESESHLSMRRRAKKILDKAYSQYPNGNILMVAHSGINKAIISLIMKTSLDNFNLEQKNTAINIFDIKEDGKHHIYLLNCTKHLD